MWWKIQSLFSPVNLLSKGLCQIETLDIIDANYWISLQILCAGAIVYAAPHRGEPNHPQQGGDVPHTHQAAPKKYVQSPVILSNSEEQLLTGQWGNSQRKKQVPRAPVVQS